MATVTSPFAYVKGTKGTFVLGGNIRVDKDHNLAVRQMYVDLDDSQGLPEGIENMSEIEVMKLVGTHLSGAVKVAEKAAKAAD